MHLPAQAVAGHIPVGLAHGSARFRIALERTGDGEHRARQIAPREDPMQAPEAGAAAIHEHAFGCEITAFDGGGRAFRQRGLGGGVAIRHGIFAAFFVVDHEIDGDMRAVRPVRIWRPSAIPYEISRTSRLRIAHVWLSYRANS